MCPHVLCNSPSLDARGSRRYCICKYFKKGQHVDVENELFDRMSAPRRAHRADAPLDTNHKQDPLRPH